MAYGNIYYSGWHSDTKKGYLYIDKIDYAGTSSELVLKRDGFSITTNTQQPLLGMTLEFSLMNLETDFFTLLPLMYAKEREYKVRVVTIEPETISLFTGFLNCDQVYQKYLKRQSINFVASGFLSKLQDEHPVSIDTLKNITFIEIIDEILRSTGADFPIRINSILRAEGDTLEAGYTLFDKNGVFTELFWEDNVERTTSLEILKTILISFNCVLYWFDDFWYIERYSDIWNTSVDYVEYSIISLVPASGDVVPITNTVLEVHDLVFTETAQTLAVNPGIKKLRIDLQDKRFENLVNGDLSGVVFDGDPENTPEVRTWVQSDILWDNAGQPYSVLNNAIYRRPASSFVPYPISEGLSTTIKTTVLSEDTSIEIQFGYVITGKPFPENTWRFKDYTFRFHYYVRINPEHLYIVANESEEDEKTYRTEYSETSESFVQYVEISGSSFESTTQSVNVNISIPLGLVEKYDVFNPDYLLGNLSGDQLITIGFGAVTMYLTEQSEEQKQWEQANFPDDYDAENPMMFQVQWAYFGDFIVSETGNIQANVIEGTFEPNFVNKESISLDLYDSKSYSYKNSILRGTDLDKRTERWGILADGTVVNQRGVCYSSTNNPPTIADPHTINGTGFGTFNSRMTGLNPNTLYYVRAYAIDGEGNVVYATLPSILSGTYSFTTLNLVVGSKYGGGTIGYIFQPGDDGYIAGQIHGLIVSDYQYRDRIGVTSGGGPYTSDANRIIIGGGFANTEAILANPRQGQQGLSKLVPYRVNNFYNDWFLPSYNELKAIWANRDVIGGFEKFHYWTSTEPYGWGRAYKYCYAIDFSSLVTPIVIYGGYNNGYSTYWQKTHTTIYFRFVRKF